MNPPPRETVLITGASSGIGLELAKCFAAEKSNLVLVARTTAALEKLAVELREQFHIQIYVLTADLARHESPQEIFDELGRAGQVVDVLPNGMLVIEAARQVTFSQQTQTIVLRGLVRPEDISQQNQILSTAISSLELDVRGKGIISDYTHRPNVLVRLLQQLLIF